MDGIVTIMLSEISQAQKDKYHIYFSHVQNLDQKTHNMLWI
jgi:hypothetical protein